MSNNSSPVTDSTAFAMVCLATASLAFKGIFAKLALQAGLTVAAVLLFRALFATPLFALVMRWRNGKRSVSSPNRRDVWLAIACGNLFTLATALDIYALSIMDVGVSRAILFTFPLFVQLLGMLHQRRRPQRRELLTFAVAYSGLLLMLGVFEVNESRLPPVGVLCVFGSAASYGAYLYYGRNLSLRLGADRFNFLSNSSTLLVFLFAAPFFATSADLSFSWDGMVWIAGLVVISTVIPFLLLFEGMRTIEAAQATLISLASPVISLSFAAYLFDERVSGLQMVGFVLVLLGVSLLKLPLPKFLLRG
ncbi:MAG: DMT family transporter [Granulosicoccaceae bacterium]